MLEQATPRGWRRFVGRWCKWPVVIVVVFTVGALAYSYRPLNSTERRLVGAWEQVHLYETHGHNFGKVGVWFRTNRSFSVISPLERLLPSGVHVTTQDVVQQGRWEASSTSVAKTFDVPGASPWDSYRQRPILFFYHLIGRARTRYPIRFEGPDRVWMNNVEYRRVEAPAMIEGLLL